MFGKFFAAGSVSIDDEFLKAAQQNNFCGIVHLLNQGANVNAKNKGGLTAAHFAATNNNDFLIAYLYQLGADINAQDNSARTPLDYAVRANNSDTMVGMLILCGADPTIKNNRGEDFKYLAIVNGNEKALGLISETNFLGDDEYFNNSLKDLFTNNLEWF